MSSNYETLYGVGLLDDLHNFFPALLYDSSSFGSVRDVLGYIQSQTRNRFDLFSYGLREYQSINPLRGSGAAFEPLRGSGASSVSAASGSYHPRVVGTSFASIPTSLLQPASTLPIPSNATATGSSVIRDEINRVISSVNHTSTLQQMAGRPTNIHFDLTHILRQPLNTEDDDGEEADTEDQAETEAQYITNTLLTLLNLPAAALTRTYARGPTMDQFLEPVPVRPTAEQIEQNTTLGNRVSDTDTSCAICQDALTSEQEGRKLNACGHWFHKSCIDTWLAGNVHCPVCRHDIREPPASQES
jgi:hypothetical protein